MKKLVLCLVAIFLMVPNVFGAGNIPQDDWELVYVSSEETNRENTLAVNAFDGNKATFWHTLYSTAIPKHPHEIEIDLGAIYIIEGFRYLPRQDTSFNGSIKDFRFYAYTDRNKKGLPVISGTFVKDKTEKTVMLNEPVTGRYISLVALNEVNGNSWTSAAEINVIGSLEAQNIRLFPVGAVRVTISPSPDSRVEGHFMHLTNTVTGETTKSDMAKAIYQTYQANELTRDVIYRVTSTAYATINKNFFESDFSNSVYFKLYLEEGPPPEPLAPPSIISIERIN